MRTLLVFVKTTLVGTVCFIKRQRVRPSGLSIHEAGGILKRIGIGSAARLQKYF